MTSLLPSRDWAEIHWPKISRTDAARWIAVLPLAATEQHGPHLPLETDVLIGAAYLARVRERLPAAIPATFLPVQPIGISTEHIHYPGTRTLPTEVALRTWIGLGESVARAGVSTAANARSPAVNARGKNASFMIGLRRSFWPMMGAMDVGHVPRGFVQGSDNVI